MSHLKGEIGGETSQREAWKVGQRLIEKFEGL